MLPLLDYMRTTMGTGRRASPPKPLGTYLVCGFCVLFVLLFASGKIGGDGGGIAAKCNLSTYDKESTTELDLRHCKISELPTHILAFEHLVKLDVSFNNDLKTLPPLPPTLEVLFAMGTAHETIPSTVATLPALRMLSFKSCRLRDIGAQPLPTALQWLILTDNELTTLPPSFGRLTRMRKLMLANNRLTALPEVMREMQDLELLRVANNLLADLPTWLLALPNLTWLAIAGNPCVASAPARASLAPVNSAELTFGDKLGEGTSSIVRRGEWKGTTVALKAYKAQLSSDGRNLDEVRASVAVDHPNVLRWLGYLEESGNAGEVARASGGGGSGKWKLIGVLEWAPGFASLGKPPSMATITRDTYPPGTSFTAGEIKAIAIGIASALEHLHGRSLSHGDVYAHNILWRRGEGTSTHAHRAKLGGGAEESPAAVAKLSDFGAAFYYGGLAASAEAKRAFERMEQRAYGFLLEELLERYSGPREVARRELHVIRAAAAAATSTRPEDRPGFSALLQMLREPPGRRLLRPRGTFGRVP